MNKKLKLIIEIIILTSLLLRFSFVINHINHKCIDDDCPICNIINNFKSDLKTFIPNINKILITILNTFIIGIFIVNKCIHKEINTLINLKVRLNN